MQISYPLPLIGLSVTFVYCVLLHVEFVELISVTWQISVMFTTLIAWSPGDAF